MFFKGRFIIENRIKMKKLIILMLVVLAICSAEATAQSYRVIVNESNTVSSISQKDLAMVFLKKRKKWDNDTRVMPVDQKANAKVRETFSMEVFKKKVAVIRSYWQKAMFSGMAAGPDEKNSDLDVIEYVKHNKGGIGYISTATPISGVKVISVDK